MKSNINSGTAVGAKYYSMETKSDAMEIKAMLNLERDTTVPPE